MRQVHVAESGSGSLAGLQVVQNSGSRMFMLRVKPCQREFATDEIRERKYTSTERSNGSIPFADSESATQPVA